MRLWIQIDVYYNPLNKDLNVITGKKKEMREEYNGGLHNIWK